MRKLNLSTDLCVVGGGPAGLCTALAAARKGIQVVLMQNRPMLGGNSSSEIRMQISTENDDRRETGILEELELDNYYYNPGLKYPLWDNVLYAKVKAEENITLLLNCCCMKADCTGRTITSVTGWQMTTETWYTVKAQYFADCSGDGILAPLTGAAYMLGREDKEAFGESLGQPKTDQCVMGMSILIQFRETNRKQTFVAPPWAYSFPDEEKLEGKIHTLDQNFWWIEYGGMLDVLHDNDRIHEELLKIAYGVVDHLKNQRDHGLDNWELEWVGCLPGRRESRRYVGKYIVTQNDVESGGQFDDKIAFACWTMDNHFPEGFYHPGRIAVNHPVPKTWGIPWRSLIARDVSNLLFAGRNFSITHLGFSSARVMAPCCLMGQALGTGAAMFMKTGVPPEKLDVRALQQQLLFDDCFLPGIERRVSALTAQADATSEVTRNGLDRGEENLWLGQSGDEISLAFQTPQHISGVRIVFDSNLSRNYHNMPFCYPLEQKRFQLPQTLVKDYRLVYYDENHVRHEQEITNNHQRLALHALDTTVTGVSLIPVASWGDPAMRVFSFEVY